MIYWVNPLTACFDVTFIAYFQTRGNYEQFGRRSATKSNLVTEYGLGFSCKYKQMSGYRF